MTNANEEEVVTTEENETDTDTTEVTETTEESTTEDVTEETDTVTLSKSDYDKLQRGLARKARIESKDKSKESSEEGYDQDLIARTYLAAQAGVTDADVQDEALRLANKFGMKIDQAMRDPDISTRLKNLQKQKQTQAGIAGNGGQNVGKPKSIEQYTAEFNKTGNLPDDPRLVSKILDQLTKK
jgi:Pyruvate/2-oxoacid:ferredoxin oxidoreductase gamma subunit